MEKKPKIPKRKKIVLAAGILFTVILGLLLTSYIFVHSFINNMSIIKVQADTASAFSEVEDVIELEPEPEDSPDVPDSPKEEIIAVENKIKENMEESSVPIIDSKEVYNILLIGSDTRSSNDRGRSDAMIIISINDETKTITATSIMRDIYLQIPGKKDNRINASYAYGGADLLMDTIKQNFKIEIDRYVLVDFGAFKDVVDEVGGITLDLTEEEIPFICGDMKLIDSSTGEINVVYDRSEIQSGTYFLDGEQTLSYARIRYIGNSDFDRTERQRKILKQIYMNVKDLGILDLNQMFKVISTKITTDLSEGEILSLILGVPKFSDYDLQECRIPIDGSYKSLRIRGMSVLGIDFEENIDELDRVINGDMEE